MQDWASHLEHLQSILQKFDKKGAPEKSDLIRFFCKGLRPSIKAQMKQRGQEHNSWEELIEKAINAEAKTSLQPPLILCEIDQRCLHGNRVAYSTVAKSQASSNRDPCDNSIEKPSPPLAPKPSNSLPAGRNETSDKKTRRD